MQKQLAAIIDSAQCATSERRGPELADCDGEDYGKQPVNLGIYGRCAARRPRGVGNGTLPGLIGQGRSTADRSGRKRRKFVGENFGRFRTVLQPQTVRTVPSSQFHALGSWSVEFPWSLDVGAWSFRQVGTRFAHKTPRQL